MRTKGVLPTLLFVCLTTVFARAQKYTITDLGPLAPTGINSLAQVVGNYDNQAYVWSFGRMNPLGLLPNGTFSTGATINDLGAVTGTADGAGRIAESNVQCPTVTQPFVWTAKGGMQGLGTTDIAGYSFVFGSILCNVAFYGRSINANMHVVGDAPVGPDTYAYGLSWTSANGMSLFGLSWPPTFANGISNTEEIVGQDSNLLDSSYLVGHAAAWQNGNETLLEDLGAGQPYYGASADGVNDRGAVVGWSTTSPLQCCGTSSPTHAVLWTPVGVITDLGTLPGDTSSVALRINHSGQVIGSSGDTLYFGGSGSSPFVVTGRPFIWTQSSGMQDLNTLIHSNSGWVLNTASDINVWGQIVGNGTLNGQPHGYLLTPKNPFQQR